MKIKKRDWLRLPVIASGSEYLVMGHLMRRNILTYKAPPGNEGYDLVCMHPNPKHIPRGEEKAQVRVQVKSCYATDCNRSFPVKDITLNAFDFLIVVFLNIGKFYGKNDGSAGQTEPELYTLTNAFIKAHHNRKSSWQKVELKPLEAKIQKYKNERGFEQIARDLGIPRPTRGYKQKIRGSKAP